ncbi:hypothetical protein [Kitasatospora purpeofusca]|uniref:hypothetical protein n=1 Tax=Kitasatospora purpeofusca TaxID=67352 RepID=UPI002A5A0F39|nr:hypothetical protein [Kitasatospora purpeofusca]MDY0813001.1 hypothetical protein [Kitasatospora purpeofusca]
MTGRIEFDRQLSGSGWATCRIADAVAEAKCGVSYIDALAGLRLAPDAEVRTTPPINPKA